MEKVVMGEREKNIKYDFRETCFGIVRKENELLLVRKKGQFSLIGGGVEHGESCEECLKREFLEESGYTITKVLPFCVVDCFWLAAGKWPMESLANFFLVEVDFEHFALPTDKEHEIHFVPFGEVLGCLPLPYQKKAIELFLEKRNLGQN